MSRVDRIVARHMEAPRSKTTTGQARKRWVYVPLNGYRHARLVELSSHHKQGDQYWRIRLADLCDRRIEHGHGKVTYKKRGGRFRPIPPKNVDVALAEQPKPTPVTKRAARAIVNALAKRAAQRPSRGKR